MTWHLRVQLDSRSVIRIFKSYHIWQIFGLNCISRIDFTCKRQDCNTNMAILHHAWSTTNIQTFNDQGLTITGAVSNIFLAAANGSSGNLWFQEKRELLETRAPSSDQVMASIVRVRGSSQLSTVNQLFILFFAAPT